MLILPLTSAPKTTLREGSSRDVKGTALQGCVTSLHVTKDFYLPNGVVGERHSVAVLYVAQQAVRPGQHGVLRDQVTIDFPH